MKIECPCGHMIPDNTDFQSWKAYLIADQDQPDLFDEIEAMPEGKRAIAAIMTAFRAHKRAVYQCSDCGRLLLQQRGDRIHDYVSFRPDDATAAKGALRSKKGARWRGSMVGHWGAGSLSDKDGSLFWDCSDDESGLEEFDTWEALESRYREMFENLRQRDVLRGCMLKKDGEVVHHWSLGD